MVSKKKPIALILNDTYHAYHWGCYGTSKEISETLIGLGYILEYFSVVKMFNLKTPPRTEKQMNDAGFRRAFLADNPELSEQLEIADLVVLNGEGSLHGINQMAFNILYVTNLAKTYFNKKVYGMNMSLFPRIKNSDPLEIEDFYKRMLLPIDKIILREDISYQIAQRLGLNAHPGFDLLATHIKRRGVLATKTKKNIIILGGGLGLDHKVFFDLFKSMGSSLSKFKVLYLTGALSHPASDDLIFIKKLTQSSYPIAHKRVSSFSEWVNEIRNCRCLISGRFHHTIAAQTLGTPYVVFAAQTPKILALCNKFGIKAPINSADQNSISEAIKRITTALESEVEPINQTLINTLIKQSKQNFYDL